MNGISTCLFKKKILLATILMEMIIWKNTAKMITWIREFRSTKCPSYTWMVSPHVCLKKRFY